MGRMAGKAGELASALLEAPALRQIERLVPCIPRIIPVRFGFARLLSVAGATELVQLGGAHPLRIADRVLGAAALDVPFAGTVAGLATDTGLERNDPESALEPQRASRVALKTSKYGGARIERSITLALG